MEQENNLKRCSRCKNQFPATLDFFHKETRKKSGLSSQCSTCSRERTIRSNQKRRERYVLNPDLARYERYKNMIYYKYNLREDTLRNMFDLQKGCCKICSKSLINPEMTKGSYHIDHSHTTTAVRGLLCGNCNVLLGQCSDSIEILESAIKYLKEEKV